MSTIPPGTTSIDDLDPELIEAAEDILNDDQDIEVDEIDTPEEAVSPTPVDELDELVEEVEDEEEEEEEESEIGEKQNPIIAFAGQEYDRDSTIVGLLILFMWSLIWRSSGLSKALEHDTSFKFIYFIFAIYVLLNISTSGKTSGGVVYELNILLTVEQMISILFGTVVLFALFGKNLPVHENCRPVVFRLSMSIVVILTTASLWVNVWTSGRTFRAVRKFKQGVYNVALTLFIIIGLIFIKGNECAKTKKLP